MLFTLAASIAALAVLAASAPQPASSSNSIPIWKRSGLSNGDKTANLDALAAHIASVKNKYNQGFNNFEVNTGTKHPSAIEGHQKRGDSIPLIAYQYDEFWYCNISVGTPARQFTFLIDSGSSDMFLPSSSCHTNCDGHELWDPNSSSTAVNIHKEAEDFYGNGSVSVKLEEYTDTVSIAGYTATKQAIGAALTYDPTMVATKFAADGIVGLAFESISVINSSSLFFTLVDQGRLPEPVFSVWLSDDGGELEIGGANSTMYYGDFAYTNVTTQGYWQVITDNIQGNGVEVLTNITSVIDTGTTGVCGTRSDVAKLHRSLNGTLLPNNNNPDFYTYPCNSFPNISFTLGGVSFPISEDAQNFGPVTDGSSDCVSGIYGEDIGRDMWVMGDTLLRNVYTTFDSGNSRVGFAKLSNFTEAF